MSSITKPSYHCANDSTVDPIENNIMSDHSYTVTSYDSFDLKQNPDNYLNMKNTCSLKDVPDISINGTSNTLIFITTDVDTELQIVAKRFVENLLLQAQKEVNEKVAKKHQVLLSKMRRLCLLKISKYSINITMYFISVHFFH